MPQSRLAVHPLRLEPGQELFTSLLKYVKDYNLKGAFIMTCCGSLTKATIRLAAHSPVTPNNTIKELEGPFEIVSLVGTLSGDDGHLHIALSDKEGHMIGGHVVSDLIVFTTAEVVIGECTDVEFVREYDPNSGFPELVVKNRLKN